MAGELGSRDGPFPPGDYRFYAHDGRKFAFHAAPKLSIQPPLPPSRLFCSSPAMQRPALGTTLWSPSRPATAGGTVMVAFAIWACWRGVASHQLG